MENWSDEIKFSMDTSELEATIKNAANVVKLALDEINTAILGFNESSNSFAKNISVVDSVLGILSNTISIGIFAFHNWEKILTIATTALSALISPVGIAIGVIGGLAAVFSGVVLSALNEKSELEKLTEATKKVTEEHIKMREESNKVAESSVAEIDRYGKLKNELDRIVDSNGKVIKGYEERAGFITSELSKATGIEIKSVNGMIDNYKDLSGTIDALLEKKRAKAILDAHEGDYADALKNQTTALKEMQAAESKLAEVQKGKEEFVENYQKKFANSVNTEKTLSEAANEAWKASIKEYQDILDAKSDKYGAYTSTIRNWGQAESDFIAGNYGKINQTVAGSNEEYASSMEERKRINKENIQDSLSALKYLNENKDTINSEQFDKEKALHEAEIVEAQKKLFALNNAAWENTEEYSQAMAYLSSQGMAAYDENGNLTEAALAKIESLRVTTLELAPQYSEALKTMADNGQLVFNENGELTIAAQQKLVDTFSSMNEISPTYSSILSLMAQMGQTVFNTNGELTTGAQKKLIDAYATMNNSSPSYRRILMDMANEGQAVFDKNGNLSNAAKKKIEDAEIGIQSQKPKFNSSLKTTGEEGLQNFTSFDYYTAMLQKILDARRGVEDNKSSFLNSISNVALLGSEMFWQMFKKNPTSKSAKQLSRFLVKDLQDGIEDNKEDLLSSINELGKDAFSELEESLSVMDLSKLIYKMQSTVDSERMQLRGTVSSVFLQELFSTSKMKMQIPKLTGTIHGNIENHIMMDSRETAIRLSPFISEELVFTST